LERTPGFLRISGRAGAPELISALTKTGGAPAADETLEVWEMKESKDFIRIIGIVLLGLFVIVVGVPLVMAAAGITLGIVGMVFGLAVGVIKLAIVVAIIYLVLVGIRAMLR
jgi:hypothetical protein